MKLKKLVTIFLTLFCIFTTTACDVVYNNRIVNKENEIAEFQGKTLFYELSFNEFCNSLQSNEKVLPAYYLTINTEQKYDENPHYNPHFFWEYQRIFIINNVNENLYSIVREDVYLYEYYNKHLPEGNDQSAIGGDDRYIFRYSFYSYPLTSNESNFTYEFVECKETYKMYLYFYEYKQKGEELPSVPIKGIYIYNNGELVAKFFYEKSFKTLKDSFFIKFLKDNLIIIKGGYTNET